MSDQNGFKAFSREELEAKHDVIVKKVLVPEWGENAGVFIKSLNTKERGAFEQSILVGRGQNKDVNLNILREKFLALTVCDQDGKRLWDSTPEAYQAIGRLNASAVETIFEASQKLSGLRKEDVDHLTKNSESIQSEDFALD